MWFSVTFISAPGKNGWTWKCKQPIFYLIYPMQGVVGSICLRQEIKLKVDSLFFREVLLSVLHRNENYWEPNCQIVNFFSYKFINSLITDLLTSVNGL